MSQPQRTQNQEAVVQGVLGALLPELRALQDAGKERAEQIARMDERQFQMAEQLDKITEVLYGNGKPGIKSDLEEVQRQLAEVAERHEHEEAEKAEKEKLAAEDKADVKKGWRNLTWGIIAAFVALAIDIARDFLLHH
jgi:hypothetical protein